MTTKAVAYIRVSSEDQKKTGYSLPHQDKRIREYAEKANLELVAWFGEARSAKPNAKRPEFNKLVAYLREHREVRVILVNKDDRAMRNASDFGLVTEELGVHIVSVADPLPDTPLGRLTQMFGIGVAKYFVENLSQVVKGGMREKFESGGIVGKAPVGYLNLSRGALGGKRRSEVIVDEVKAPIVRSAFERYATGQWSLFDIALLMAQDGHVSAVGKPMTREYIAKMLRNPTYLGMTRCKGEVRPGLHPALISVALFDRVAAELARRQNDHGEKGTKHYLLRGLLRCADCGGSLTAEDKVRGSYYHCFTALRQDKCVAPWSPVATLDRQAGMLVNDLRLPPDKAVELIGLLHRLCGEAAAERTKRLSAITERLPNLEQELDRLVTAFAAGKIPDEAYLTVKDRLVLERARLDEERDRLAGADTDRQVEAERVIRRAASLAARYEAETSLADKKAVLAEVVKHFIVHDKAITDITYHHPYELLLGSAAHAVSGDETVRALLGLSTAT